MWTNRWCCTPTIHEMHREMELIDQMIRVAVSYESNIHSLVGIPGTADERFHGHFIPLTSSNHVRRQTKPNNHVKCSEKKVREQDHHRTPTARQE